MLTRILDYQIHSAKIFNPVNLMLLSDVHIGLNSQRQDERNMNTAVALARSRRPDGVLIAGDLLDTLELINDGKLVGRLREFLVSLSEVAPVFIGVGNHDQGIHFRERHAKSDPVLFRRFCEFVVSLPEHPHRIELIHDKSTIFGTTNHIKIVGVTLPADYYGLNNDGGGDGKENRGCLERHMRQIINRETVEITEDDASYYTLALVHSPKFLDDNLRNSFPQVDLFVSGHVHGGMVPVGLYGLTKSSDRGIIAADGALLPARSRGLIIGPNNDLLVLGAIKAIPTDVNAFIRNALRPFYPPEITFLRLLPNR